MHVNDMFPSDWLKAYDLKGKAHTVTIEKITKEQLWNRESRQNEDCWVLWFVNADKGLILNKGHAETIAEMYGPESNDWISKRITIVPKVEQIKGEQKEVVRVSPVKPATKPADKPEAQE